MSTKNAILDLASDLTSIFENSLYAGLTEDEIIEASDEALNAAIDNVNKATVANKTLENAATALADWFAFVNPNGDHLTKDEIKSILKNTDTALKEKTKPDWKTFQEYLNSLEM